MLIVVQGVAFPRPVVDWRVNILIIGSRESRTIGFLKGKWAGTLAGWLFNISCTADSNGLFQELQVPFVRGHRCKICKVNDFCLDAFHGEDEGV